MNKCKKGKKKEWKYLENPKCWKPKSWKVTTKGTSASFWQFFPFLVTFQFLAFQHFGFSNHRGASKAPFAKEVSVVEHHRKSSLLFHCSLNLHGWLVEELDDLMNRSCESASGMYRACYKFKWTEKEPSIRHC